MLSRECERDKIIYSLLLKLTSIGFILLSLSYIFFSLLSNNVLLLNKKSIEHKEAEENFFPSPHAINFFIYSFVIEKFQTFYSALFLFKEKETQ